MKRVIMLLFAITVLAVGNPTHYRDGRWYTCDQYDYDTRGNLVHEKWSDGDEAWYRWFGSKGRGQVLQCRVDRDGNPI